MKITIKEKTPICFVIVFYLIVTQILSNNISLIIILAGFFLFLALDHFKLELNLPGKNIYFLLFFVCLITGMYFNISKSNQVYSYMKQVLYFLCPFLYWVIGTKASKYKQISHSDIISSLCVAAVLYSIYDIINSLLQLATLGFSSLYEYRQLVGTSNFLALIGIYMLIFYNSELHLNKFVNVMSYIVCFASLFLHFSRTSIIELIILIIFSGLRINFKRVATIAVSIILAIVVFSVMFPDLIGSFFLKSINSIVEINQGAQFTSYSEIVHNWRGYESYCELVRFNNASIFEQIFGNGFGTTLDPGGYAYLVTQEKTLLFLHNGYFTLLMISGVSGILMYVIWLIQLFRSCAFLKIRQDRYFLKGLVFIILLISYFVRGPLFGNMSILFFIFGLIYEKNKQLKQEKNVEKDLGRTSL